MSNPIIEISIDVSELVSLAAAVPGMTKIIEDEIRRSMEESGMLICTAVTGQMHPGIGGGVNTGLLRASIMWPRGFELRGTLASEIVGIVGVKETAAASGISPYEYVSFVEHGTVPHFPPIAPITLWAIRKFPGGVTLRTTGKHVSPETFAYIVQHAIAKKGTPAVQMFKRGWTMARKAVFRVWNELPRRVIRRFDHVR